MAAVWRVTEAFLDKQFARTGWVGNPRLFSGKIGDALDSNPLTRWWNNAFNGAPGFKWALSVVPLHGALTGKPPVENLDLNQSLALASTGVVWGYYSLLVLPRSWMLFAVSVALFSSNGWNVFRKIRYDRDMASKLKLVS